MSLPTTPSPVATELSSSSATHQITLSVQLIVDVYPQQGFESLQLQFQYNNCKISLTSLTLPLIKNIYSCFNNALENKYPHQLYRHSDTGGYMISIDSEYQLTIQLMNRELQCKNVWMLCKEDLELFARELLALIEMEAQRQPKLPNVMSDETDPHGEFF
jgi:hypothetical protein